MCVCPFYHFPPVTAFYSGYLCPKTFFACQIRSLLYCFHAEENTSEPRLEGFKDYHDGKRGKIWLEYLKQPSENMVF
jgi:hypothetical protein